MNGHGNIFHVWKYFELWLAATFIIYTWPVDLCPIFLSMLPAGPTTCYFLTSLTCCYRGWDTILTLSSKILPLIRLLAIFLVSLFAGNVSAYTAFACAICRQLFPSMGRSLHQSCLAHRFDSYQRTNIWEICLWQCSQLYRSYNTIFYDLRDWLISQLAMLSLRRQIYYHDYQGCFTTMEQTKNIKYLL